MYVHICGEVKSVRKKNGPYKECKATVIQDKSLLVEQGFVNIR